MHTLMNSRLIEDPLARPTSRSLSDAIDNLLGCGNRVRIDAQRAREVVAGAHGDERKGAALEVTVEPVDGAVHRAVTTGGHDQALIAVERPSDVVTEAIDTPWFDAIDRAKRRQPFGHTIQYLGVGASGRGVGDENDALHVRTLPRARAVHPKRTRSPTC